ncbi:spore cortex protein [Neisseriaceae bacterium ESL0693]|nr:spore cortex protein [Neisseriaceae bacterium ESL0693]
MRIALTLLCSLCFLAGCTWETYQDANGQTKLRQKYEPGSRVVYQDGTYSHNLRYNSLRPEPHVLKPSVNDGRETLPPNTHWPTGSAE